MAVHLEPMAGATLAATRSWAAAVRAFDDVEDPRPYVDHVLDDEFPLSIFYSSLKAKLAA